MKKIFSYKVSTFKVYPKIKKSCVDDYTAYIICNLLPLSFLIIIAYLKKISRPIFIICQFWYNYNGDVKMSELLAPAGSYEAFLAAISNGCDAVYLGLNVFSARAYAENFTIDNLEDVISYAHLRNVKVHVTMNTICYESELPLAYKTLDKLNEMGVDAIIVQDLALLSYIKDNFPNLEAHASTQTGIDNIDGVRFFEELKADRVVLAREVPIDEVQKMKKQTKMPLELFMHGALCVSYSGNCLMSGLIGLRSGNRGRCVGSCRKKFTLLTNSKEIGNGYLLSMKDLNTTKHINELKIADSLKIEGRMKEPTYVASVVKNYRALLDNNGEAIDEINLNLAKTFNRTFTKGYLFHEDKKNITNIEKPNNYGYKIGKVIKTLNNKCFLELFLPLKQGDQIRIQSRSEINLPITKLFDKNNNLIKEAKGLCCIELKEKTSVGDIVYKTMDIDYLNNMKKSYPKEFRRLPLDIIFVAKENEPLSLSISYQDYYVTVTYGIATKAINNPTSEDNVYKQLSKLNDTPYEINNASIYLDDHLFINMRDINELRRLGIKALNEQRIQKREMIVGKPNYVPISFKINQPKLACYCTTIEQYEAAKESNIEIIYFNNVIRRNHVDFKEITGEVLVGGYSGVYHYKGQEMVSDFSLNVVNAKSVNLLHSLGVKRVTLSHEINNRQIKDLIKEYQKNTGGYPNLEMIVYGRQDLLFTEYCPLKKFNLCGKCKDQQYYLRDDVASFPLISHDDCTTTILNSKTLNLIDDLEKISFVNVYRLQFTIESKEETQRIINQYKNRLNGDKTNYFNERENTRGHFNKEIL